MRVSFALLLAVTAMIAVVSGSSVNLRAFQKIQSSDIVQDKKTSRELRGDLNHDKPDPDAEERLNLDFLKSLTSKLKGDPLKSFAKKQTKYVYSQQTYEKLLTKFSNPDKLFTVLKLNIPKNRSNKYGVPTWESKLHQKFLIDFLEKNRNWRSALP